MPTARSIADIKARLLQPALTSHFEVKIPIPPGLSGDIGRSSRLNANGRKYMEANGISQFEGIKQETLNLLCCETVLPGSNIGTIDITNDYHGATHRHAHRRIYDDRIDMTFYVDSIDYLPIRYFEVWMKYVVGESVATGPANPAGARRPGSESSNYFYRMNYPDLYIAKQGLEVTKFERTGKGSIYSGKYLTYKFVNAFPISISSMPVSYDTSSLLKCTVSFSYVRYFLSPTGPQEPPHDDSNSSGSSNTGDPSNPANQAIFNNAQFATSNLALPGLSGTGALNNNGISRQAANSSGNTVSGFTIGANANVA